MRFSLSFSATLGTKRMREFVMSSALTFFASLWPTLEKESLNLPSSPSLTECPSSRYPGRMSRKLCNTASMSAGVKVHNLEMSSATFLKFTSPV